MRFLPVTHKTNGIVASSAFPPPARRFASPCADLVPQTHQHLGRELEEEGQYGQAEHHFVLADMWKLAVAMYRAKDMWDDAYRVAKQHGTPADAQRIGYFWAKDLGGDSAVKLLTKFGMVEEAIDLACDQHAFEFAFEVARAAAKGKLADVYFQHAVQLEEEHHFAEAEAEFIKAARPKEAVLMCVVAAVWLRCSCGVAAVWLRCGHR